MIGLYSSQISPFAARVWIQLRYKGIEWEPLDVPAAGLKSEEFLKVNPAGKIPVLILADGTAISESETILDFIEQTYPDPSLLPDDPLDRARMRATIRAMEGYVSDCLFRLFAQIDSVTRDPGLFEFEINRWRSGLKLLDQMVDNAPYAVLGRLTLADCVVFPGLQLCEIISDLFGLDNVVGNYPALSGYLRKGRDVPVLGEVYDEIAAALAAH